MKKRKRNIQTLQEWLSLHKIEPYITEQEWLSLHKIDTYTTDWNYNAKATKTNDIRTTIQGEQDKTRREDIHTTDTGIRQG